MTNPEQQATHEAQSVAEATPARSTSRFRHPRRTARRRFVAAGAVGGVSTLAALAMLTGGAGDAYAVGKQAVGGVRVTTDSVKDAAGLEDQLRAVGIHAVVTDIPAGKVCAGGLRFDPNSTPPPESGAFGDAPGTSVTFASGRFASTITLLIEGHSWAGHRAVTWYASAGAVSPCVLVDAPAASAVPIPIGALTDEPGSRQGQTPAG